MKVDELKGKKVAIIGMGVNNQKMADYFKNRRIKFDVVDGWKNETELIGKLDQYQVIFRSPGLPYLSKSIQQAKNKGAEITSQTQLFFSLCPAKIIGVTGTKGKGTTSSLIAKILSTAHKPTVLAGNIGLDPFEFLDDLSIEHFVVMELSSFQLQDMKVSPHVAVVVNLSPDHLDHHKNLAEYYEAKQQIVNHQTASDFAILNKQLPDSFKTSGLGKKIFFDSADGQGYHTKLLGPHNRENIAAAVTTAKTLGIKEVYIKGSVASFESLPHRLSFARNYKDVTYIDDSYSTNVESTMAAIDSFDSNIILIVGGADKKLDFHKLGKKIVNSGKVKGVVVIGQIAEQIVKSFTGYRGKVFQGAKNMDEIIIQAHSIAKPGDVVLLSPATSSFGMFKNATDRAEQFRKSVNQLR
jgi:UDP-N-acetylmuramoylalanine--D-glutamate ligase